MSQAHETLEGWYALHDVRKIDWNAWKALAAAEREEAVAEAIRFFTACQRVSDSPEGSSALYSLLGHKGDLLILHLRPTLRNLGDLELAFAKTHLGGVTTSQYSYLSVVELSQYAAGGQDAREVPDPEARAYLERRLKPQIPAVSHICFYPMSKRRGEQENWYMLPLAERRELMAGHGAVGRRYAGRVTQMITGSVGLDDWEWGVTLFGEDPLQFKKLVQEMRFDPASARFAEFGPFLVGLRLEPEDLREYLGL